MTFDAPIRVVRERAGGVTGMIVIGEIADPIFAQKASRHQHAWNAESSVYGGDKSNHVQIQAIPLFDRSLRNAEDRHLGGFGHGGRGPMMRGGFHNWAPQQAPTTPSSIPAPVQGSLSL